MSQLLSNLTIRRQKLENQRSTELERNALKAVKEVVVLTQGQRTTKDWPSRKR